MKEIRDEIDSINVKMRKRKKEFSKTWREIECMSTNNLKEEDDADTCRNS